MFALELPDLHRHTIKNSEACLMPCRGARLLHPHWFQENITELKNQFTLIYKNNTISVCERKQASLPEL